ncbi:MAG TPA: 50S ribosomal protein L9 [Acidimicrobiales bacterium]|jgi:large subunit ribosomal protein L9|nr:50S ribosomal protein L9 [Acidimicrobiales bacterium]
MRVVLRSDLAGLGRRGDIVDVADGYARNHLVPSGLAIVASDKIAAQAAAMRRRRDLRDSKEREAAEAIAQRLVPMTFTVAARAGSEGRLFGSVTASDVVAAVASQAGVELDRHKLVAYEPVKTLGVHEVRVRLHPEVEFALTVEVVPA